MIQVRSRNVTWRSKFLISSFSTSLASVCHHAHWGLPVICNNSLSTQKSFQGSKAKFFLNLVLLRLTAESPLSTSRRMRYDQHFHHEFTQEWKTFYLRSIIPFNFFTPEINWVRVRSAYFLRSEQNGKRFHSLAKFFTSLSFAKLETGRVVGQ